MGIALSLSLSWPTERTIQSSFLKLPSSQKPTPSSLPLAPRAPPGACLLGGAVQFLAEGDPEFLAERRELVDVLLVLLRVLRLLLCFFLLGRGSRESSVFRPLFSFSTSSSNFWISSRAHGETENPVRPRREEGDGEGRRTQALEHADGGRKVVYPTSGTESLLNDCGACDRKGGSSVLLGDFRGHERGFPR